MSEPVPSNSDRTPLSAADERALDGFKLLLTQGISVIESGARMIGLMRGLQRERGDKDEVRAADPFEAEAQRCLVAFAEQLEAVGHQFEQRLILEPTLSVSTLVGELTARLRPLLLDLQRSLEALSLFATAGFVQTSQDSVADCAQLMARLMQDSR